MKQRFFQGLDPVAPTAFYLLDGTITFDTFLLEAIGNLFLPTGPGLNNVPLLHVGMASPFSVTGKAAPDD
jgi:hypothetical protein